MNNAAEAEAKVGTEDNKRKRSAAEKAEEEINVNGTNKRGRTTGAAEAEEVQSGQACASAGNTEVADADDAAVLANDEEQSQAVGGTSTAPQKARAPVPSFNGNNNNNSKNEQEPSFMQQQGSETAAAAAISIASPAEATIMNGQTTTAGARTTANDGREEQEQEDVEVETSVPGLHTHSKQYIAVKSHLLNRIESSPASIPVPAWCGLPDYLGDGMKSRLLSLATLHLTATGAARCPVAVRALHANSNKILLGAAPNCDLYQERVVRAVAQQIGARFLLADAAALLFEDLPAPARGSGGVDGDGGGGGTDESDDDVDFDFMFPDEYTTKAPNRSNRKVNAARRRGTNFDVGPLFRVPESATATAAAATGTNNNKKKEQRGGAGGGGGAPQSPGSTPEDGEAAKKKKKEAGIDTLGKEEDKEKKEKGEDKATVVDGSTEIDAAAAAADKDGAIVSMDVDEVEKSAVGTRPLLAAEDEKAEDAAAAKLQKLAEAAKDDADLAAFNLQAMLEKMSKLSREVEAAAQQEHKTKPSTAAAAASKETGVDPSKLHSFLDEILAITKQRPGKLSEELAEIGSSLHATRLMMRQARGGGGGGAPSAEDPFLKDLLASRGASSSSQWKKGDRVCYAGPTALFSSSRLEGLHDDHDRLSMALTAYAGSERDGGGGGNGRLGPVAQNFARRYLANANRGGGGGGGGRKGGANTMKMPPASRRNLAAIYGNGGGGGGGDDDDGGKGEHGDRQAPPVGAYGRVHSILSNSNNIEVVMDCPFSAGKTFPGQPEKCGFVCSAAECVAVDEREDGIAASFQALFDVIRETSSSSAAASSSASVILSESTSKDDKIIHQQLAPPLIVFLPNLDRLLRNNNNSEQYRRLKTLVASLPPRCLFFAGYCSRSLAKEKPSSGQSGLSMLFGGGGRGGGDSLGVGGGDDIPWYERLGGGGGGGGSRAARSRSPHGNAGRALTSMFPNTIELHPPHADSMARAWKKMLDADVATVRERCNRAALKKALLLCGVVCTDLDELRVCDLALTGREVEQVVGAAVASALSSEEGVVMVAVEEEEEDVEGDGAVPMDADDEPTPLLPITTTTTAAAVEIQAELPPQGKHRKQRKTKKEKLLITAAHLATAAASIQLLRTEAAPAPERSSITDLNPDQYERQLLSEVVPPEEIALSFDDIGALDAIKTTLHEVVILPLQRPELFTRGALTRPTKGLLLFGPPGTGKTMLAKAVASESGAHFININMSAITSKWLGEGERLVRAVFSLAHKLAPSVIFVDEIDSFLAKRGGHSHEHEALRKMKTEFLAGWDGIRTKSTDRVMVLAATNRPMDLDEAAIRRMPRRIFVPLPDATNREKVLSVILKDEETDPKLDLAELGRETEGYSGSDLKNLAIAAAYVPLREMLETEKKMKRQKPSTGDGNGDESSLELPPVRAINMSDFKSAMKQVTPSTHADTASMSELQRWNEQFGEGGSRRNEPLVYYT